MKKLKNTTTNKLLVTGGVIAIGYFAGKMLAKPQDKKTLSLAGAFVGLLVAQGVISWIVEPKQEAKSNAEGVYCNKNRTNKPCLDWVIGKGWTNIRK